MAITSLDLANKRIDLSDVLSWAIAQAPGFIKLFDTKGGITATQTEHKWLEGVETPKTKQFTAYAYSESTSTGTFTVADSTGWQVGDYFHLLGDSAVLKITSVTSTTIVPVIAAANGSTLDLSTYTASSGGTLVFDSRPIQEGSTLGENVFQQSSVASNYTQIFRADINLTNTALAVGQYGNENAVSVQVQHAIDAVMRRMNSALIFGAKVARTASIPGSMGGLYHFGTQTGGLGLSFNNAALSLNKINNAAQLITEAGGTPNAIICGPGQAQVISTFMNSNVYIDNKESIVGRYVNQFITAAGGHTLRVFVESAIPDGDVWVVDTRGFALVPLAGRALKSEPSTTPGKDGVSAYVIGEYTAQFKNAKQALCRISGLKSSATVLT